MSLCLGSLASLELKAKTKVMGSKSCVLSHRIVLMAIDRTCYEALFNKNIRNGKNLRGSVQVSSQCCPLVGQECHVGVMYSH